MYEIELSHLSVMLLPALLVIYLFHHYRLSSITASYALARMLLQLCLVGYCLAYIFDSPYESVVVCVLIFMMLIASWISLRTAPSLRAHLFLRALLSIAVVNVGLLMVVSKFVLQVDHWHQANVVIPLAGMLFASGMTSISLVLERLQAELNNGTEPMSARGIAFNASLIPSINSLFSVGLVSLPGMMTGQILSGVSPMIAARYQIMVMLMLFSSAGLTVGLFLALTRKTYGQSKEIV